jgi:hypothetical protein
MCVVQHVHVLDRKLTNQHNRPISSCSCGLYTAPQTWPDQHPSLERCSYLRALIHTPSAGQRDGLPHVSLEACRIVLLDLAPRSSAGR